MRNTLTVNPTVTTVNEILNYKYNIQETDFRMIDEAALQSLIDYLNVEISKPDVIQNKTDIENLKIAISNLLAPVIEKKKTEEAQYQKQCKAYKENMIKRKLVIKKAKEDFFKLFASLEEMEKLSPFVPDSVSSSYPVRRPTELSHLFGEMKSIKNSL